MSKKLDLPALDGWRKHAGGIGAAPGKYGYTITFQGVTWSIEPVSTRYGRHMGYRLYAFGLPGERTGAFFGPDGKQSAFPKHRSPASACKVARIVHQVYLRK